MTLVATTLAYVRTADNEVLQIDEGGTIPADVELDGKSVARLIAAGVLTESTPEPTGPPAVGSGAARRGKG